MLFQGLEGAIRDDPRLGRRLVRRANQARRIKAVDEPARRCRAGDTALGARSPQIPGESISLALEVCAQAGVGGQRRVRNLDNAKDVFEAI